MNIIKIIGRVVFLCLLTTLIILADDPPYGNVKLLDGYKYKRYRTIDTINGLIYKNGGLHIEFESGISEGYAADPKEQKKYIWFRQQAINGHTVFLALTESGIGSKWQPKKQRGKPNIGKILIITFPGKFSPMDASNFYAEVLDDKEILDTLLMVLTFDPSK
jgi:hypothetical protein